MVLQAIVRGLVTFVLPPVLRNRSRRRPPSPRYCYSVFLRHLTNISRHGLATDAGIVAEIGPGGSVGVGLAALAAGAKRYYGFDVRDYGINPDDVRMFDELATLMANRAPIPGAEEFPGIRPAVADNGFPHGILTNARLERALAPMRLAGLREGLSEGDTPVSYVAPWYAADRIEPQTVDWIFSQAAMEYVDDLPRAYAACARWLKPGAVMSHQIDYRCHGTARRWNGHWAYSDFAWRLVRGARSRFINRQPHSAHLKAILDAGFELVATVPVKRDDGLPRPKLAPPFRTLEDADLVTAGAFIIARNPPR